MRTNILHPVTAIYKTWLSFDDWSERAVHARRDYEQRMIFAIRLHSGGKSSVQEGNLVYEIMPAKIGEMDMTYFRVTSTKGGSV